MALNLKHQTKAQFLTRLRDRYKNSSGTDTARLATLFTALFAAGDLVDAELEAVFALNKADAKLLKDAMKSLADANAALKAAKVK